jgi:hypothetical protein
VKGGEGTLVIDEILGMIPAFEERLPKQLKPAGVPVQGFPLLVVQDLRVQPEPPGFHNRKGKTEKETARGKGKPSVGRLTD